VADIDRGGVFAHIVGTLIACRKANRIASSDSSSTAFRGGDIALLEPGRLRAQLPSRCWQCCPICGLFLDAERGVLATSAGGEQLHSNRGAVGATYMSISTGDFDALRDHRIDLRFIAPERVKTNPMICWVVNERGLTSTAGSYGCVINGGQNGAGLVRGVGGGTVAVCDAH
jgi:cobyric acid synthase